MLTKSNSGSRAPFTPRSQSWHLLDRETQQGNVQRAIAGAFALFAPPPELTVSQWAEKNRQLSSEASAEPGQWRNDRAPYLADIMDCYNDPAIREVWLVKASQIGWTEVVNNILGYIIDQNPGPAMVVQPTVEMAEAWSKQRLAPMLRDTKCLADKVSDPKSRNTSNTLREKMFAGGYVVAIGANAPAGLASRPIRDLLLDEVSRYPLSAGTEGDPIALAGKRQETFWNRKLFAGSSPTVTGDRTMQGFMSSDQRYLYVPCPACSEKAGRPAGHQRLAWKQMKWTDGDPASARYECQFCQTLIEHHHKHWMLAHREWRAHSKKPFAGIAGFHVSELYSPFTSWERMVQSFIAKKDIPTTLQNFVNTSLGEVWNTTGSGMKSTDLEEGAEPFPLRKVPAGALVLTAGVDVQDDRFEVVVWAFGPPVGDTKAPEMWTIDRLVMPANPGLESEWARLDQVLLTQYEHALGGYLGIEAVAVDTGGHYTHETYNFVRTRPSLRKVHAIKGADRPGMAIVGKARAVDVNYQGVVIRGGVKLWEVGVHAAKDVLFGRIRAKVKIAHFSRELPHEFFLQMASEAKTMQKTARGERPVWAKVQAGARNEAWDCSVYALWCAERLRISEWPVRIWDMLRAQVALNRPPAVASDAAPGAAPAPEPPPAPKPRRLEADDFVGDTSGFWGRD